MLRMPGLPRRGLWQNRDFLKLWGGETVSLIGTQINRLALPFTAVEYLRATPGQMGLLNAASFAPFLIVTLFAGVWVDQRRRRPILVWTNLVRGVIIAVVPLLAIADVLQVIHLFVIAFAVGVFQVLFDTAYQSYLPRLVEREELVEGNSKLQLSLSAAQLGGPGLGGMLVQALGAPLALAADAVSYLVSATSLGTIRHQERAPEAPPEKPRLWPQIREGLQMTFGNPYLRAVAGEAATFNLAYQMIMAMFVLYAARYLDLSAGIVGVIIATASAGSLLGSLLAAPSAQRVGVGPTILIAMIVACVVPIFIPLVAGPELIVIGGLMLVFFVMGLGVTVANVHVVSLRQTVTPDRLLGRMNASYRFLIFGTMPLGGLLAGLLGDLIGPQATLLVAGAAMLLAPLWVLFSPVKRLQRLEDALETPAPGAGAVTRSD